MTFSLTCFGQTFKDTSQIGVYLKSIYDLSPSDFSFGADFYIWSNSTDSAGLFRQLEIVNSKQLHENSFFQDIENNKFISYENCKVQLTHNWQLRNYPFDKQELKINIEAQNPRDFMILTQERNSFQIANNINIPGWTITDYYVKEDLSYYPSDFGYQMMNLTDRSFNKLSFTILIKRQSWGLYFKLFSGLYVAFLVSFLAFFVRPDFVDPRFGLSIGGLFASVANKYVVDANIPATIGFSFVDVAHFLTFITILVTLVISVCSLKLYSVGNIKRSRNLDKKAATILVIVYLLCNTVLVLVA